MYLFSLLVVFLSKFYDRKFLDIYCEICYWIKLQNNICQYEYCPRNCYFSSKTVGLFDILHKNEYLSITFIQ